MPSPRSRLASSVAVASALPLLLLVSLGARRPVEDAPAQAPGVRVLFDGKTLDGWKTTEFFKPGEVKVVDGAIVLSVGHPMNGVTSTLKDLPRTDYELSYEARRDEGKDFFAAATFPVGKSHITLVNGGWGGYVTGLSSLNGSDASENETTRSMKYKDHTWYRFRVRVTDAAIRCWVDDAEVIVVDITGRDVGTRAESNASQPLGFATWETGGSVRKIQIRKLTPAEVAANKKPEC